MKYNGLNLAREKLHTDGTEWNVSKKTKIFACIDCLTPFYGQESNNSKYCEGCRTMPCICSHCLKTFVLRRCEINDGRGLYCSLVCYREHLKLFPPTGEQLYNWKGGLNRTIARRARLRSAEGSHTKQEWEQIKKKYNNMCLCCKKYEPEISLTEDHIVPLIAGGSNFISNIQPLCRSCNGIKSFKTIDYRDLLNTNQNEFKY